MTLSDVEAVVVLYFLPEVVMYNQAEDEPVVDFKRDSFIMLSQS